MTNITTKFLGLELKSPVVVSSSGLTKSVESLKEMESYGAGAVILKSLFEEQINVEAGRLISQSHDYPEAEDYIRGYAKHNSVDEYLKLIRDAKANVKIPVIASINCVSSKDWTGFAKKIQDAGADALELNINIIPQNGNVESLNIESKYYDIVEKVLEEIDIPLAVKIGPHFTNIMRLVKQLQFRGVKAVTLFNRFYEPEINIDKMEMVSASVFSKDTDIRHSLRWVGMVSGSIKNIEIAASTGIHDGGAVVKQLLAGAQVAQVCSVLYKKGAKQIKILNDEVKTWMQEHNFENIEDFRGKMSWENIPDSQIYMRSQFMKYFSSVE
ncbi:MAG: dihydroorotate dehydrogenase-like protein [Bacteroidales bacterium]|jgi:dihydroorotate dehydrogenase (fumarate)|nr:dihydroorotate dehydrogenase-like protein [Bacteroidales bacterium]